MLIKDIAICIRAIDYSETSQIVTFFTRENGKLSAIAKGSKRPKSPFDGPIEILSFGSIVFSNSTKEKLATLTEFQQEPAFVHLTGNLFALHCAYFGAELAGRLTDDYDPHPELFDRFLQFLKEIPDKNHEKSDTLSLLILFQLALLKEIGLMPTLAQCANCKTAYSADWPQVYFSTSANGLICRDCEPSFHDKMRLTKNAATCLADLKALAGAQERTLNEVEKVLVNYFTDLLHRPPRMAKYILSNT